MSDRLMSRYILGARLPVCRPAEAWDARDLQGRPVALAVVACAKPDAALARFDALAQVRHPRLAVIVEWAWEDGRCVLVSERARGLGLGSVLAAGDTPACADVASWGAQAAEGLAALHGRGLVHGGLCPAVLVLDEEGDVTVTGAGIAIAAGPLELADGDPPQNAFYVSPEEVLVKPLTPASDVYALAATLYRLAAGQPPFGGTNALEVARRHVAAQLVPPRTVRPDLTPALDHILRRALDKDPRKRPSAAVMARDLERAALGARVEAPVVGEGPGPGPRRPWWPWVVGLALIAVIAGVLWGAGTFAGDVRVPDVTGLTLTEARSTLGAVGLAAGTVTRRRGGTPQDLAGTVLEQSPPAGTGVREGELVDLVVAGYVVVPDLRGMTTTTAETKLEEAGLIIDRVATTPSRTVAPGLVAEQSPVPGATVPPGTPVTLYVAAGSAGPSPSTGPSRGPDVTP